MFEKQITLSKKPLEIYQHFSEVEALVPEAATLFLQKDYFLALEKAEIPALSFRYIPFYHQGKCEGFFYFQLINLSAQDLGKIIHFEPYNKILSGVSMLLQNMIFGVKKDLPHYLIISGNMCLSGEFGISKTAAAGSGIYRELTDVLAHLKSELEKKGKVAAFIVKDYPAESDPLKSYLSHHKFSHLAMDPIMKMDIRKEWKSMTDYVNDLSSKYRQRYNQAKKKLEKCTVRTLNTDYLIRHKDKINELYKAVQDKSPVHIIKPDANYLIALSTNLQHSIHFQGIFLEDELIAFLTGIDAMDHYEAHHIGIDYKHNKEFSIYLNILYLYIEMAITHGASRLSFGRTAMEMKTTVGALAVAHHAYIKLNNSLLNGIIKKLLPEKIEVDWVPRDPFRK